MRIDGGLERLRTPTSPIDTRSGGHYLTPLPMCGAKNVGFWKPSWAVITPDGVK